MESRFIAQKVLVYRGIHQEPQHGTIVGETRTWFAVSTKSGCVEVVRKDQTYPHDAHTLQRIKEIHRKYEEAKNEAFRSLIAALESLPSLVSKKELEPLSHAEVEMRIQDLREGRRYTMENVEEKLLLRGLGQTWGIASGPVTVVWCYDDLPKVKPRDVVVAEDAAVDWPWCQAAMLASALSLTSLGTSRVFSLPAVTK